MNDLRIEILPLTALTPYAGNAKTHTDAQVEQIARAIERFGMNDPIAVWGAKNVIVEGHGRYRALQKLGCDAAPVIRLDHLSDDDRKAYALAHNQLTMNTGWNDEQLVLELAGIDDIDMGQFGFLFAPRAVSEDDFDATVPDAPFTQAGDIWMFGRHRLLCGDATKEADVLRLCDGAQADLLLTDPPYNVAYTGGTASKLTIQNDDMKDGAFHAFLCDAFTAADAAMKNGASFYIWHADSEGFNFRDAALTTGWVIENCLIWDKNAPVLGRQDYLWKHEPCLFGHKPGAARLWAGKPCEGTVLSFKKPARNAEHPTMKPVLLFDHLIQNSTREMDIVLDPFAGSGTTFVACEQNGRTAYGMELDARYASVIVRRYAELIKSDAPIFCLRDGARIPLRELAPDIPQTLDKEAVT